MMKRMMENHREPTPIAAIARLYKALAHAYEIHTSCIYEGSESGDVLEVIEEQGAAAHFAVSALEAEHYNYPTEAELGALLTCIRNAWSEVLRLDGDLDSPAPYRALVDNIIEAAIPILETRDMLPKDVNHG